MHLATLVALIVVSTSIVVLAVVYVRRERRHTAAEQRLQDELRRTRTELGDREEALEERTAELAKRVDARATAADLARDLAERRTSEKDRRGNGRRGGRHLRSVGGIGGAAIVGTWLRENLGGVAAGLTMMAATASLLVTVPHSTPLRPDNGRQVDPSPSVNHAPSTTPTAEPAPVRSSEPGTAPSSPAPTSVLPSVTPRGHAPLAPRGPKASHGQPRSPDPPGRQRRCLQIRPPVVDLPRCVDSVLDAVT